MFVPASRWYCCLTAADKSAVGLSSAAFIASLEQPIPADVFDAFWIPTLLSSTGNRQAILYQYGLEDTFIIIPDEPPIPAVGIVNLPLWLDIEGFILTGGSFCDDGCDAPSWSAQR